MTLTAGTRLGPYEIVAPLGAGGMGEVYRAHDTRLGRDVAVKVLPRHLIENSEVRARFEREARTVSSLNHPHICTLHDIGREGDTDYLVMELVEGETLADRLAKGALPAEQVLKLGAEIADALDKAHRAGIVHRDLKPGNIMLARSGAKLMDFGLARATTPAGTVASGVSLTGLTQSPTVAQPLTAQGSIVGTFQYMAPEQLEGTEADVRSDLWALGCVLYEMATGKRAFSGATQASLISSIMKDQPRPIGELQSVSPPGLDRLVRSCLEKDPEERIQTAHDVRIHLRWIAEGGSQAGVPAPVSARRRNRERLAWGLVAAAGAAAVALAVLHFGNRPPAPHPMRFEVSQPAAIQTQDSPRISPDGLTLAYNATDSTGITRLWTRPLGALTAQPLPGTEGAGRPFWSPDSRFLAFMAGGKLKKISASGGPATVICDAPSGADGTWSRRGVILFDGGASDPIMRVAAGGGVAAAQVRPDSGSSDVVGWPEFLPDGDHYFYLKLSVYEQDLLCVGSLRSGESQELGPCESQVQYIAPGHVLYSRGGSLVIQRFDARGLKLVGEPIPVAEQVGVSGVGGSDFRASDNGVLVYSTRSSATGQLAEFDRTGELKRVLSLPSGGLMPVLARDERRVAVRVLDPQTRTRDIWMIDRTRDIATRFTFEKSNENYPLWSPDGKRIAYWSDAGGGSAIMVKRLTGSGETELIATVGDGAQLRDWSSDGSTIFFEARTSSSLDIWTVSTTGDSTPRSFLNAAYNEALPQLSPDGRFLAYVSDESGRREVYVQTYPDQSEKWQVSTRGGEDLFWSADGRQIYYLTQDQQMMSVPVRGAPGFDPGTPVALFGARVILPGSGNRNYVVTADGQTFIMFTPTGDQAPPSTTVVLNWMADVARR